MGDFITIADLTKQFQNNDWVRLTNNDGSVATTIDVDVMNYAIEQAESLVKSAIQSKYLLPFTTVPTIVRSLSGKLTYYFLNERKFAINDKLQVMYENCKEILNNLSKGLLVLDTDPAVNSFQNQDTQDSIDALPDSTDVVEIESESLV